MQTEMSFRAPPKPDKLHLMPKRRHPSAHERYPAAIRPTAEQTLYETGAAYAISAKVRLIVWHVPVQYDLLG
jgi:hypothetical protein